MSNITIYGVSDMEVMAHAIAHSKLFGAQTPEQALALCLIAQAEGRHPASAAQDYHIIQGRPAKKSDAMLRDFLSGGGKVEWHKLDDDTADATFSHPSGGSVRISWDMARAKKAGLNTPMWSKFPRQMLRARTVSEGVRTVYPMATSGMYVPEEVQEFEPRDVTPARVVQPKPAKALPAPKEEDPFAETFDALAWADTIIGNLPLYESPDELRTDWSAHLKELKAADPARYDEVRLLVEARGGELKG